MAQKILILGGARSGKSEHALKLAQEFTGAGHNPLAKGIFIATAQALDEEMAQRISRHKEQRGDAWECLEEPVDLAGAIRGITSAPPVVVIDCLTLWISNLLLQHPDTYSSRIDSFYAALETCGFPVIMVSNEVGLGIVPGDPLARQFRDVAGRVHQRTARICDTVFFISAGIPVKLK